MNDKSEEKASMSVQFWMAFRQAILMFLDALERELIKDGVRLEPRTAELRKWYKDSRRKNNP